MTFTLLGGNEAAPRAHRRGFGRLLPFPRRQAGPGPHVRAGGRTAGRARRCCILSYEFWQKQERGDPNIVGKKYQMNDRAHTVIGVLPPIPQYPNENDVYMTTTSCPFRIAGRLSSPIATAA